MPWCSRDKGKPVSERFRTPLTADSALRIHEGLADYALDRRAVYNAFTRSFSSLSFPRGQTCIMDWWLSWPFRASSLFYLLVIFACDGMIHGEPLVMQKRRGFSQTNAWDSERGENPENRWRKIDRCIMFAHSGKMKINSVVLNWNWPYEYELMTLQNRWSCNMCGGTHVVM